MSITSATVQQHFSYLEQDREINSLRMCDLQGLGTCLEALSPNLTPSRLQSRSSRL